MVFADSVLASWWPTMSWKSRDFIETICDLYRGPGRVLLELGSWWCHRQAHESPCSKSVQSMGQTKQEKWETPERDPGSREAVMFHTGSVVTVFSRGRFQKAIGSPPHLWRQSLFLFIMIIKIIYSMSTRNHEALVPSVFLPCVGFLVTKKVQPSIQAFPDTVFPSCQ